MKLLQEAFDQGIEELFSPEKLGTELVKRKLEEIGIKVNKTQLSKIKKQFIDNNGDTFNFEFEDGQVSQAGFKSKKQFENALADIFTDLSKDLEDKFDNFEDQLPSIVMDSTDRISVDILNDLKKGLSKHLKLRKKDRVSFESRLIKVYKKPFNLLEMLIAISSEAGDLFNQDLRHEEASSKDNIFDILTRLHARACQIAYEILILLKSGLADGAHARWRTLYEIAVTAYFLCHNSNDISERYALHDSIEMYKSAKIFQENCADLGLEPISDEEISDLESVKKELIKRFGKSYYSDYGWASSVLKINRPTFRDIEIKAGLKHLRPYYKMACHNVHANPRGIFFKLGLYPESGDILLAGPSNVGLTDPGQLTALSLAQITVILMTHQPNIDRLTVSKIAMRLEKEIGQAFIEAENSIKS